MGWHKEKIVEVDKVLRHPADTKSWKEFDKLNETFANDLRNIRLGLSTNGFNLFGSMSNAYSIWPVLFVGLQFASMENDETIIYDYVFFNSWAQGT